MKYMALAKFENNTSQSTKVKVILIRHSTGHPDQDRVQIIVLSTQKY